MHSGGANTILRNNRKLLKKRSSRFKDKRTIMGLKDKDIVKKDDQNRRLTTMSASEMRRIGRKYRIHHRIEMAIVLLLILAALIWVFSSFKAVPTSITPTYTVTTKTLPKKAIKEVKTVVYNPKTITNPKAEDYMEFGRFLYRDGQYVRAKKIFLRVVAEYPNHCQAPSWLNTAQDKILQLKRQKTKKQGETRYKKDYPGY